MRAWWKIMPEQGEQGAKEGEWRDAAVRVSAATQANTVTGLKEEFVSLLKNVYFQFISVEEVGFWRFLWVCITTRSEA